MNNMNALIVNLHNAIRSHREEIEALQKELDELKASIPKIKADLINSVLDNCAWYHNREFIKIDELIEYANQLEGKE